MCCDTENHNPVHKVRNKGIIEIEIVRYLPETKRDFKPKAPLHEIVNAILFKLKTGSQWEYLPVYIFFGNENLNYKTVFGHYRKWCVLDAWKSCICQNKRNGNKDNDYYFDEKL